MDNGPKGGEWNGCPMGMGLPERAARRLRRRRAKWEKEKHHALA